MQITIRQEFPNDHEAVFNLITEAFKNEKYSDQQEPYLVEKLRLSDAFIPELSLVAIANEEIVGHILLTTIAIKNDSTSYESLALAPVSVLPKYQKKGIGSQLIIRAHEIAKALNYKSIVLLGHEDYYPRFGYERADLFGITLPFEVPPENCMVKALFEDGLKGVHGIVSYPSAFYE